MIHITEGDQCFVDSVCGGENDQPIHRLVATTGVTTATKGPAMYEVLNAHAAPAEHEVALAEMNLILAHMPEREIHPGRVTRVKNWVAAHRQDRELVTVRQSEFNVGPSIAGVGRNV